MCVPLELRIGGDLFDDDSADSPGFAIPSHGGWTPSGTVVGEAGHKRQHDPLLSQQQAAAVYAATKGTMQPAYVSPFAGRLDNIGQNGMDVVKNIKRMFSKGDGHVLVLAASILSLEHLLYRFVLQTELATVPAKILELWASKNMPMPDEQFQYKASGKPIPYDELDLDQSWETFDVQHELTRTGIEKFAADYRATLSRPACSGLSEGYASLYS
jgi:transaldolase